MKKSKLIKLLPFLSFILLFVFSCNDDDEITTVKPAINLTEVGIDNIKKVNIGSDLHIEAKIIAENLVDKVTVKISKKDGESFTIEKSYDEFSGIKNPLFHKHIDIPINAPAGEYKLQLIVTDKKGQSNEALSDLMLIDSGNNAPEPKNPEFEGVKLIVTYQDNNTIDMREPHSERNDILKANSPNSKVAQNLSPFISNAIVYNANEINYIDTGLELHLDHFHTGPIAVMSTAKGNNFTEPYWRNYFAVNFEQGTGSILYNTAEGIMNGSAPRAITNVSNPHNGLPTFLGGKYFALTNSEQGKTTPTTIKVIQSDNKEEIFKLDGFKQISARANYKVGYNDHAVYATDKGLVTLKIGNNTNYKVETQTIANPSQFQNEAFDELYNKSNDKRTSVFAVKKNSGIYNIEFSNNTINQLANINNIDQAIFNFEDSFCYVITSNNKLLTYETNSFGKIAETNLQTSKNGQKPRIVATRKFVYVAYPGSQDILRFDAKTLAQYKSIVLNSKVSDIGLAGNLIEANINNHNK